MRIAILSDLHFVAPEDPFGQIHIERAHFARAWPSFKEMCALIKRHSPDLVISLGDLVEWYSPENRDFALSLMSELDVPWVVTPGNHDFEMYVRNRDESISGPLSARHCQEQASGGWEQKGIKLDNRVIDAGDTGLVLINSAISDVPQGTGQWLNDVLGKHKRNIVFTHVPLDVPPVRQYISSVEPDRNMTKYVQSGAPWMFQECIRDKVDAVYSGHLHFFGRIVVDKVSMYILGLSIVAFEEQYQDMGMAMILDLDKSEPKIITIQ